MTDARMRPLTDKQVEAVETLEALLRLRGRTEPAVLSLAQMYGIKARHLLWGGLRRRLAKRLEP